MDGDPKALKLMIKYCIQDIKLLELVYLKLRGYMKSHPNLSLDSKQISCPKCGSYNKHKTTLRKTASGVSRQQYKCLDCYGYYTLRAAKKKKSKSQN